MVCVKRITIVLAQWCPHCVPLSLDYAKKMAGELEVPLNVLDIDVPEQELAADEIVEKYGDYSEDYLIPQVFLEYDGGRIEHIYTGFSEALSVTESRWNSLFESRFYKRLLESQKKGDDPLEDFVAKHLVFKVECRRHCDESTSFKVISNEREDVVGVYLCSGSFVSRVVYFSHEPDLDWFYSFISGQVGKRIVSRRDIRMATRHGWELGEEAVSELEEQDLNEHRPVIKEVYWTRYAKTEAAKSKGVFLCSDPAQGKGCGKLFVQNVTSKLKLCPKCR